jgi:hypothetical protein
LFLLAAYCSGRERLLGCQVAKLGALLVGGNTVEPLLRRVVIMGVASEKAKEKQDHLDEKS